MAVSYDNRELYRQLKSYRSHHSTNFLIMDDVSISGVDAISVAAVVLQSGLFDSKKENRTQHDSILTGQRYLQRLLGDDKYL